LTAVTVDCVKGFPAAGMGRLLYFIDARLVQLRWSRADLAAAGGPTPSTLYKAARRPDELAARTLARLDFVLGWQDGSARRVLNGGSPAVRLSEQVEASSARIDAALRHAQCAGTSGCAEQLRNFLLDVAQRLDDFYTPHERVAGGDPA